MKKSDQLCELLLKILKTWIVSFEVEEEDVVFVKIKSSSLVWSSIFTWC